MPRQRSQAACRLVPAIFATCDHELSWARVRAANSEALSHQASQLKQITEGGRILTFASQRMLASARSAKSLGVA